jgi:DNA-binding transcriptional LysR family regulator
MDLGLSRLRILRELAHRGSMAAAAEALSYSPSAVSQQIAVLEREAGTALIEHVGRGVRLTSVGEVLARHAEAVLDAETAAVAAVEAARSSLAEILRVGVFSTIAAGLMPPVIAELKRRYPEIAVETREADPEVALPDVRLGHLDLAFLVDYPEASEPWPTGLTRVAIASEALQVAAPQGMLPRGPVSLGDLAELPWIVSGPETYYGRAVRAACAAAGFDPIVRHQVNEQATALAMVGAGLGITLVSDLGRIFAPPTVATVAVRGGLRRDLLLAYNPAAQQRPAIQAFVRTAVAFGTRLRGQRHTTAPQATRPPRSSPVGPT